MLRDEIDWEQPGVQTIKKHEIQGLIIIKLIRWAGWACCGGWEQITS